MIVRWRPYSWKGFQKKNMWILGQPWSKEIIQPKHGENITQCFVWREDLLKRAAFDNEILVSIIFEIDEMDVLTMAQRQTTCYRSLYLRRAYEIPLQHMNEWAWVECVYMAIMELYDDGIRYYSNGKKQLGCWINNSGQHINLWLAIPKSRENQNYSRSYLKKNDMIRYFNEQIKLRSLSTKLLLSEMKISIIPYSYNNILSEASEEDCGLMPTYGELLCMLDLKTISMMTIRRWIKILGYRYDENKFSYYTNMHACDNVVEDRYNHYLKEYVTAE